MKVSVYQDIFDQIVLAILESDIIAQPDNMDDLNECIEEINKYINHKESILLILNHS